MIRLSRRHFLLTSAASVAAASISALAFAADPVIIGAPTARSGPVGVADHADWLNGITMAVEEINAAGGVNGRMLETRVVAIDLLTPEGRVGADPVKYRNIFQIDVAEVWYGAGLVKFLSNQKAAGWAPKNNRVHIFQEQIGYSRAISKATQAAIAAWGGEWEQGPVTDIQFPVQDWAPAVQELKAQDCGVIMIDHWVAAELASFAQAHVLDPTPGALVYLQYGPSQPEFLDLAAKGFIRGVGHWGLR